jgi:hypothetical protein
MAHIVVRDLRKSFRIGAPGEGRPGLLRPIRRTVHALDRAGFRIEPGGIVGHLHASAGGHALVTAVEAAAIWALFHRFGHLQAW